jgi:hypothetical protein
VDLSPGSPRPPLTHETCADVTGPFLHGTKAVLGVGDELVPGRTSNFQEGRVMNHLYVTTLESTAAWGAQLAVGLAGLDGLGHVYVVEPTGPFEDDPNVTDKKFPGNPTRSFRTRHPMRVVAELTDWTPHPPEAVSAMLDGVARMRAEGRDVILD